MCPQPSPRRLPHAQCGITPHSTPQLGGPVLGPLGCVGPMEAQPPPVTSSPCPYHAGQTPASLPASLPHHLCSHPDGQRVQAATAGAGDQQQPPAQRTLDGRGAAGQVPPVCAGHLPGVRLTPTPHSSLSTSALMPPQLPAGNASQRARTATRCAHGLAQPVDRTRSSVRTQPLSRAGRATISRLAGAPAAVSTRDMQRFSFWSPCFAVVWTQWQEGERPVRIWGHTVLLCTLLWVSVGMFSRSHLCPPRDVELFRLSLSSGVSSENSRLLRNFSGSSWL